MNKEKKLSKNDGAIPWKGKIRIIRKEIRIPRKKYGLEEGEADSENSGLLPLMECAGASVSAEAGNCCR